MGANVYANGKELSAKSSNNKTVGKMPDVCLSPPSPPAGPIPIPYPNFSKASDTTDGSKNVKVKGKEAGLKGKSSYKKSKGNEAATRNFGASLVSHKIQGAIKHQAGSMDVKIEGSNAVRFGDLTTGNHSNPGLPPGPDMGGVAPQATEEGCAALHKANESERERLKEAGRKRDPSQEHKTVRRAAGGNTTISHASWYGPGEIYKAASKAVIHKYDNDFSQGLKPEEIPEEGNTVDSKACGGHKYKKTARPHTSHTEARIIEEIFSADPKPTGGNLILAINWPGASRSGKSTYEPCKHCQELICAATECLTITVCYENEPADMKDICD